MRIQDLSIKRIFRVTSKFTEKIFSKGDYQELHNTILRAVILTKLWSYSNAFIIKATYGTLTNISRLGHVGDQAVNNFKTHSLERR